MITLFISMPSSMNVNLNDKCEQNDAESNLTKYDFIYDNL